MNEFQDNLVCTKVHKGFYFTPPVSSINCMMITSDSSRWRYAGSRWWRFSQRVRSLLCCVGILTPLLLLEFWGTWHEAALGRINQIGKARRGKKLLDWLWSINRSLSQQQELLNSLATHRSLKTVWATFHWGGDVGCWTGDPLPERGGAVPAHCPSQHSLPLRPCSSSGWSQVEELTIVFISDI